jgi:hypothetical protein
MNPFTPIEVKSTHRSTLRDSRGVIHRRGYAGELAAFLDYFA